MIHIDLDGQSPDAAWLEKADAATAKLLAPALSDEDRYALIKKNEQIWRDLMPWLKGRSVNKCWYSEANNCVSYWHVDHFRPKSEVKVLDGTVYEGYWWLAFAWQNYRLAGSAVNVPKSSTFPIREKTEWALGPDDDVADEHPYLLDPTCLGDPELLVFDEQGKAAPAEPGDSWHKERAEVSIDVLNLNYDSLRRGRKRVWDKCSRKVAAVLQCKAIIARQASASQKQKLRDGIDALKELVARDAEFSAVASNCIRAQGDTWLERTVFSR